MNSASDPRVEAAPLKARAPETSLIELLAKEGRRVAALERKLVDRSAYLVWRTGFPWRFMHSQMRARLFPRFGRGFRNRFFATWTQWRKVTFPPEDRIGIQWPYPLSEVELGHGIQLDTLEQFVTNYMARPIDPTVEKARNDGRVQLTVHRYKRRLRERTARTFAEVREMHRTNGTRRRTQAYSARGFSLPHLARIQIGGLPGRQARQRSWLDQLSERISRAFFTLRWVLRWPG